MKGLSNKLAKFLCKKPGKEFVWLLKRKERKGKGEESEAIDADFSMIPYIFGEVY